MSEVLACGLHPHLHPEIKRALTDSQAAGDLEIANRDAIALGCFGVPWRVADSETYFGQDRLYFLEQHLEAGQPPMRSAIESGQ